jgi:hypothetical protein
MKYGCPQMTLLSRQHHHGNVPHFLYFHPMFPAKALMLLIGTPML